MKNLKIIGLLSFSIFLLSCQKPYWPFDEKVNVILAEYEIITNGEFERGYAIHIKLENSKDLAIIHSLIVNGFEFENPTVNFENGMIEIEDYYPIQSKLIQNFESPKRVENENGIVFGQRNAQFFFPVKFTLKKK